MKFETKVVHGSKKGDSQTGAISFPIYQTATFRHPGLNQSTGYAYSRETNPTREELENTLAMLEGGSDGLAFSSGMAAIAAVMSLFEPGDHIIVSEDLYGGTYRLFEQQKRYGLQFTYLDTCFPTEIEGAWRSSTKAVFIETPSNPMMRVTDIGKVARIAADRGGLTICDNTFLTPYYQCPLDLGADIVVHSATKYLGGHNDTLAGAVVVKEKVQGEKLRLIQKSTGGVLAPFDSWLILRGIKTLGIRLERQEKNAENIALWLSRQHQVGKVYYPGLSTHPGHEIARRQSRGFGSMISFEVVTPELVERILNGVRIISYAESLGGVESLITYPLVQTHAAMPKALLDRLGVNEKLLRLSVGIEASDDLINDLQQAMG